MNPIYTAIILGIVEGITEFLPISSTGHLIIVNRFVNFTGKFANMFDIIIQLGAVLAVVVYFWRRLFPFDQGKTADGKKAVWSLWGKTTVAVLPALLIGGIFGQYIEDLFFKPLNVSVALLVGGVVLVLVESRKRTSRINTITDLSYRRALLIGLIQCLAMIPGTSRSAATIIGAMLLGASRVVAAEFSFFLAIPTMLAASVYSFFKSGLALSLTELELLAIGFAVSYFVAWAVIASFMDYIRERDFKLFGYYRIILGIFLLLYFINS